MSVSESLFLTLIGIQLIRSHCRKHHGRQFAWNPCCRSDGQYCRARRRLGRCSRVERYSQWRRQAKNRLGKVILPQTQSLWYSINLDNLTGSWHFHCLVRSSRRGNLTRTSRHGRPHDGLRNQTRHHTFDRVASFLTLEIPLNDSPLRWTRWIHIVGTVYIRRQYPADRKHSTKLDAEKRLALQEEKQVLEAKLLDVYVHHFTPWWDLTKTNLPCSPKMKTRLTELQQIAEDRDR